MKDRKILKNHLRSVYSFFVFFLLVAFTTSCCMLLFLNTMAKTLNIQFTAEIIEFSAKVTFSNVIFLSLLISVIYRIVRKITVDIPVKRITDAAEKMMKGNFSVRIKTRKRFSTDDSFNEIAKCFNKMARELSGIETLRNDFVANVSHELKTPLAVIQNYGTLLQTPNLSEEKRNEYSGEITKAAKRLSDLISNILKLNKLENQRIFPEKQTFDLSEQLCECLLGFENVWDKKEIEIETDIQQDVIISSDSEMLSIVWNNLLSNAFKFTDNGGKVSVSLKADEKKAVVRVTDTGCGISGETGKHIFDKFYQGDTSHSSQGNGLGLALVKRIIDITKSDIAVESELGKGTSFTVRLTGIEPITPDKR